MRQPDDEDEDARLRRSYLALGAVLILVILGAWLLLAFRDSSNRLDCIFAGHKNCDPIAMPSGQ